MQGLDRSNFLLVLGDREGLLWVLRERRMAFAPQRTRIVDQLKANDRLVLYLTRGCFRNPSRDRGRVVGTAELTGSLSELKPPMEIGGRIFTRSCPISLDEITPWGKGPELATLAPRLETFPESWAIHIRRTLVPISNHDYEVLTRAIEPETVPLEEALPQYEQKARP
ncbi:hypothetical protein [Actinomadura sp. SCN-SB]|uniref:hypothetical protein n=1 Tax=Actinomadura sp. SCN-SB TaxID=3373092 RepID=UPI003753D233